MKQPKGDGFGFRWSSLIQFRLWHLLALMAVVCGCLWVLTQAGMATCEIEIDDVSLIKDESPGETLLTRIEFHFISPRDNTGYGLCVFLHPKVVSREYLPGDRIRFRYREKNVLWFNREDVRAKVFERLEIQNSDIEEIIATKIW